MAIRILLAIEHTIFREGLRSLLELERDFTIAGEPGSEDEIVRLAGEAKPDILIIDLSMIGSPDMEVVRRFSAGNHKIHALILASPDDKHQIAEAFSLGVRGVVLKNSPAKSLIQAIRSVMEGAFWVGHKPVAQLAGEIEKLLGSFSDAKKPRKTFNLTKREMEVISTVVSGFSNKEIATKFSISEDTVKHHLTNIFDKLGVFNRLELALFSVHHGLVSGH